MKYITLLLMLNTTPLLSQPVLVYTLGEEAKSKDMKEAITCTVPLSAFTTKKAKAEALKALKKASQAEEVKAFHMVAQVPSVHIWAYLPEKDSKTNSPYTKYLLYRDYDTMMRRTGSDAEFLIKYAREHCQAKLKASK